MKKKIVLLMVVFATMLVAGQSSLAQVKRVQMHIAGYLCGN